MNLATDIFTGLVVVATAVVADEATGSVAQYAGLIEKFGVMACLLVYFLVRDYLRNKADSQEKLAMTAKYDNLDAFVREKLVTQLNESTAAIRSAESTNKKLLNALVLKSPCLKDSAQNALAKIQKETET